MQLLVFSVFLFIAFAKRYCVGELNSFDLPSYKRPITILETINNITLLQSLSSDCTINDRLMRCLSPGFHGVQWTSSVENTTHIHWVPFDDTPYCYIWNTSYVYHNDWFIFTVEISVNHDMLTSSDDQMISSSILSRQFWLQGEQPRLASDHTNMTISSLGFNNNTWQYNISGLTIGVHSYALTLQTSISSLLDCTVRPVSVSVTRPKYYINSLITEVNPQVLMTMNNSSTNIIQFFKDFREPSVAIVTQGIMNIITQNGFKTHTVFQVNGFTDSIQEVVFTSDSLCILIGGELITLTNRNSSVTWPSGLPTEIAHISGRGRRHIYGNHDIVIAWSHMMTPLYMSTDGGRSFDNVTVTKKQDYIIRTLMVHPVQDKVLILIYSDNMTFSIYYDILTQNWTNTSQYYINSSSLLMEYFPSSFGDLIVWERQTLYYSTNGDGLMSLTILGPTNSSQQEPSPYEWRDNEYFTTVTTGVSGQIAAITSEGHLLYGRTSTGHIIQVPYYIDQNISTIFFNSLGDLQVLSISNMDVSLSTVPVYSLLLSSLYPPTACPFLQLTHNINAIHYYQLDINDTIQLWVSLIPRQLSSNDISVSISNGSVFERTMTSVESQTAIEGIMKHNMSIMISPSTFGYSVLKLAPASNSLSCNQPAEEYIELLSSCPPNKHIQLLRDTTATSTCADLENYIYTIPKKYYDPDMRGRSYISASTDKAVLYNVTAWGCPIIVPFNQDYKPILTLYNGNAVIGQVTGDYVLREIHGRTDYSYNATANSVGCIRRPQTWEMMLRGGDEPWNAWIPQTYKSCFEGTPQVVDRNTQYQILNTHRPSSAIQWQDHNGMYVFAATVIARNYSFCNLTVIFGVQVYGASTFLSYLGYILLIVTCLISGLILSLSYIMYRRILFNSNLLVTSSTSTACTREN